MALTRSQKQQVSSTSKKPWLFHIVLLFFMSVTCGNLSTVSDTIFPGESLSGNQTIISKGGVFELGFFTPGKSQNYYIGIWYKGLPIPNKTVVWVANRNQHVSDPSSSALKLFRDGNLVLLTPNKIRVWSTNSTSSLPNSTVGVLLDNGNFILRKISDSSSIIWQSFDHPTDTMLPGAKFGYNKVTNDSQILTSWRSSENPAPGLFSQELEPKGPSILFKWNRSNVYLSTGEWTGKTFSLMPETGLGRYAKNLTFVSNENESYFVYSASSNFALVRSVLDVTGQLLLLVWWDELQQWNLVWIKPQEQCEVYATCGAFSSCNDQNSTVCACIQGFEPRKLDEWNLKDQSGGCVRRTPLQCDHGGNDAFLVMPNMLFPVNSVPLRVNSIEECKSACLSNCSCTAYASNSGCFIWIGELINLQQLSFDSKIGREIHIRIAASELLGSKAKTDSKTIWIVSAIAAAFLLFGIVLTLIWRRQSALTFEAMDDSLMLFKYQDLKKATKNFSQKVGEGAFGSVFKGSLPNSTAIAVKKLRSVKQDEKQFRAEVSTVGTIQHTNLIRLRGFCAEASKWFIVYDYMPKGSLESHLFGKGSQIFDWKERYNIAIGTAKGLAYLHEECRDCIIHCDIKPENILLDADYNPKVADFGLAKLVGRDFSRVLTTMRGTRGYLAPEWLSGEAITSKVDVFSFGKLLFEIISGRRNIDILNDDLSNYFPIRVANAINKGEEVMMLLDYKLENSDNIEELTRACKVACWCIQDNEKDRPTMRHVVHILEGVMEVGVPPIPQILQRLVEDPVSSISYLESGTCSSSY